MDRRHDNIAVRGQSRCEKRRLRAATAVTVGKDNERCRAHLVRGRAPDIDPSACDESVLGAGLRGPVRPCAPAPPKRSRNRSRKLCASANSCGPPAATCGTATFSPESPTAGSALFAAMNAMKVAASDTIENPLRMNHLLARSIVNERQSFDHRCAFGQGRLEKRPRASQSQTVLRLKSGGRNCHIDALLSAYSRAGRMAAIDRREPRRHGRFPHMFAAKRDSENMTLVLSILGQGR